MDAHISDPPTDCTELFERKGMNFDLEMQKRVTYKYDLPNSRLRTNWPGAVGMGNATAGFDTDDTIGTSGLAESCSWGISSSGCAAAKTSTPSGQRKST